MKILGSLFMCILLGYFWIWLVQHIFSKSTKKFSLKLFGICVILVGSLFAFSFLIDSVFPNLNSIEGGVISLNRWGLFLLYCGLIFIFFILLNNNRKRKQIRFMFVTRMILFTIVGLFGLKVGISTTVLYYLVLAYAEEFLKIGATENEVIKSDFYSSDLLFFSIFIALGFSIVENLLYIGKEIFFSNSEGIAGLIFGRGIFTSLLHFIATGLIALLLFKYYQQQHLQSLSLRKKIVRIVIAILVGVLIHWCYNLSINHSNFFIYIILIFGGYFLLTYLLYLTDSLYVNKDSYNLNSEKDSNVQNQ